MNAIYFISNEQFWTVNEMCLVFNNQPLKFSIAAKD